MLWRTGTSCTPWGPSTNHKPCMLVTMVTTSLEGTQEHVELTNHGMEHHQCVRVSEEHV